MSLAFLLPSGYPFLKDHYFSTLRELLIASFPVEIKLTGQMILVLKSLAILSIANTETSSELLQKCPFMFSINSQPSVLLEK